MISWSNNRLNNQILKNFKTDWSTSKFTTRSSPKINNNYIHSTKDKLEQRKHVLNILHLHFLYYQTEASVDIIRWVSDWETKIAFHNKRRMGLHGHLTSKTNGPLDTVYTRVQNTHKSLFLCGQEFTIVYIGNAHFLHLLANR